MNDQSRARRLLGAMIRPRILLPLFLATCLIYTALLRPWMMDWGATANERQMALPGDALVSRPAWQFTRAITIDAPAGAVWQWLVQLGQDRAGYYSYDWLENMTGADIHDGNAIRPEWQPRAVGDPVPMAPAEILGVRPGEATVYRVAAIDPGRSLILSQRSSPQANSWATVLQPVDGHTTRLLIRERNAKTPTLFARVFGEPAHFVMQTHLMRGIKARAEGHPNSPAILDIPARLGWAAAGLTVLGLFPARGKRGRWWLIAPAFVALPALALGHDMDAALAASLAVGITIIGALRYGRRWRAPFTNIAAAVMLTLLLAPDAYLVFGWAFLALILAAVGVAFGTRWTQRPSASASSPIARRDPRASGPRTAASVVHQATPRGMWHVLATHGEYPPRTCRTHPDSTCGRERLGAPPLRPSPPEDAAFGEEDRPAATAVGDVPRGRQFPQRRIHLRLAEARSPADRPVIEDPIGMTSRRAGDEMSHERLSVRGDHRYSILSGWDPSVGAFITGGDGHRRTV
jgi:hypothetical protein